MLQYQPQNVHFCIDFEQNILSTITTNKPSYTALAYKTETHHSCYFVASSQYLDECQTCSTFCKHTLGFVGVKLCPVGMRTLKNIIKDCLGMYAGFFFFFFLESLCFGRTPS